MMGTLLEEPINSLETDCEFEMPIRKVLAEEVINNNLFF